MRFKQPFGDAIARKVVVFCGPNAAGHRKIETQVSSDLAFAGSFQGFETSMD